MKKIVLAVALLVTVGVVVWLFSLQKSGDQTNQSLTQSEAMQQNQAVETGMVSTDIQYADVTESSPAEKKRDLMFKILGEQILKKMEGRLDNPYWHLKMLSDLKLHFQKYFPDNWKEELIAFLRMTFPELAEELIKKLDNLLEYEDWMKALHSTMHFNSQKERRQAMWDKRLELFGEEAYEIFEAALKVDEFDEEMEKLAQSTGSFDEKQDQYIESIREVYGDHAVGPEAPNKTQMMGNFLALDNVQQNLHALPPEAQKEKLREFRTAMGLDEAALERWDQLDQERADLRSAGERYMEQREQLASQYQGEELESKIHALQNEMFGETQAKYIRNEEANGYYRFNKPQKIGIN